MRHNFSEKHGCREGLLVQGVLALGHGLLHQREVQVRLTRERQTSSGDCRRHRRHPLLHRRHHLVRLHRQDLQQAAATEAGARYEPGTFSPEPLERPFFSSSVGFLNILYRGVLQLAGEGDLYWPTTIAMHNTFTILTFFLLSCSVYLSTAVLYSTIHLVM